MLQLYRTWSVVCDITCMVSGVCCILTHDFFLCADRQSQSHVWWMSHASNCISWLDGTRGQGWGWGERSRPVELPVGQLWLSVLKRWCCYDMHNMRAVGLSVWLDDMGSRRAHTHTHTHCNSKERPSSD